jgi:predicted metal-dependent enzyme (double-stranded beta helix superfamily)
MDTAFDDEFLLDTPAVRTLIGQVHALTAAHPPAEALALLRPAFAALLADPYWLPEQYRVPAPSTGMGGASATWLLYRSASGDLSLSVLVLPPGAATPIHDHMAWGLVGLYAGTQDEVVFRRLPGGEGDADHAPLEVAERNALRPGDFYTLLPPDGDIHQVITTSDTPSLSIHLLGVDVGCLWRHTYTVEDARAHPFRSGWSNAACREYEAR